jgi:hypothetical protein
MVEKESFSCFAYIFFKKNEKYFKNGGDIFPFLLLIHEIEIKEPQHHLIK